jgi:hypothetical protein
MHIHQSDLEISQILSSYHEELHGGLRKSEI